MRAELPLNFPVLPKIWEYQLSLGILEKIKCSMALADINVFVQYNLWDKYALYSSFMYVSELMYLTPCMQLKSPRSP